MRANHVLFCCAMTVALAGMALPTAHGASPKAMATDVSAAFNENCEPLLVNTLKRANKEIKVAIYILARKSIADALIDQARRGVKVSVKIDDTEAKFEYTEKLLNEMRKVKIVIERIQIAPPGKMHHKFAVIDGSTVVTGSFNWTRQADQGNWENLVVIESPALAADFLSEWTRIGRVR